MQNQSQKSIPERLKQLEIMVLGGEARFLRSGEDDQVLHAGHTSFHASNQPHAMETLDSPVLALVVWRNGFETAPVLTK